MEQTVTQGTGLRPAPPTAAPGEPRSRTGRRWVGLAVGIAALAAAAALSIAVGSRSLGPGTVWHVLWHDDGSLLVGAALGASGAIFQGLTRNPLGSPDFVGLTIGAATGALVVLLVLGGGGTQVAAGAILGCLATSVAIYLLAFRRGVQPFRLVLMGIGVSALLEAVNSYLIYRSRLDEALAAQVWLIGSVNGRG
jgi:ABC-type Fe3+-siderophore transport system permease subunit